MKFLIGVTIGIIVGTVYAPAPGSETRRWLKDKIVETARSPRQQLVRMADRGREKAGDVGARIGRKAAESAVEAVENQIAGDTQSA